MDGLEYDLIDLKGLLLIRYKQYGLLEDDLVILLLLLQYERVNCSIRNVLIEKTNYDGNKIDSILMKLVKNKVISMNGVSFDLTPLKQRLVTVSQKKESIDLVSMFEKEFARSLSPFELEAIRTWKQYGYEDERIVDALKEASLRGVRSIKYIEAILKDWAKNGVKKSGTVKEKETVEYNDYEWWKK